MEWDASQPASFRSVSVFPDRQIQRMPAGWLAGWALRQ